MVRAAEEGEAKCRSDLETELMTLGETALER